MVDEDLRNRSARSRRHRAGVVPAVLVIGCDTSTKKLAFCITPMDDVGAVTMTKYLLPEGDNDAACEKAYDVMDELVSQYRHDYEIQMFIEFPINWRNSKSTIYLSRVHGALSVACLHNGVTPRHVNNQEWKGIAVGRGVGRIDKAKISRAIMQTWPRAFELAEGDQDLLDSAGINVYGRAVIQRAERMRTRGTVIHKTKIKKTTGAKK